MCAEIMCFHVIYLDGSKPNLHDESQKYCERNTKCVINLSLYYLCISELGIIRLQTMANTFCFLFCKGNTEMKNVYRCSNMTNSQAS